MVGGGSSRLDSWVKVVGVLGREGWEEREECERAEEWACCCAIKDAVGEEGEFACELGCEGES